MRLQQHQTVQEVLEETINELQTCFMFSIGSIHSFLSLLISLFFSWFLFIVSSPLFSSWFLERLGGRQGACACPLLPLCSTGGNI